MKVFVPRVILASLVAIFLASASFGGEPSAVGEQANSADQRKETEALPEKENTAAEEWFGSDLPWWKWSHLSGNWGGWRSSLSDAGISLEAANILDWARVASGGLRRRSTARNLLDLRLTVDLKLLTGMDAGTIWARYYSHFGRSGSRDAGDIQGFSNIDLDDHRHQLAEVWYEQRFFNEALRLKIGKVDANTEFAFTESGAEFLNSSMGFSPTIVGLPTYPDPATGVNLFLYPTEHLYAGFGAYDGAGQRGVQTGSRGPATFFRGLNKLFYIGEVGTKWSIPGFALPGRLGIGGWHHNDSFDRFNGGRKSGTAGFYLFLDQLIWCGESAKEDEPKGIGMFFQYGSADGAVSEIKRHVGGGFVWTGPIAGRDEDTLGTGITWVRFSGAAGAGFDKGHELAVETFYKISITGWLSAKPDLQYIVNPSGARSINNALVPGMRFEWTF
jgi:porin